MQKISREHSVSVLSYKNEPAVHIESGETLVLETFDCFHNILKDESHILSQVRTPDLGPNPATGPVYVNGAEPGDILKADILEIKFAESGVMTVSPGFGECSGPWAKEQTKVIKVHEGKAYFSEKTVLPLNPMIGVIGCAPAGNKEISTNTPGEHGGNMDCKEITAGVSLYLPVNVSGALFALGDLHACMGDGETSGTGIEISGEVTVKLTVIKKDTLTNPLPLPLLKNNTHIMAIYSDKTLDAAAKGAFVQMHSFAVSHLGLTGNEAAMLLSAACDLRICQIVDPLMTCRMEMPLSICKDYGYLLP